MKTFLLIALVLLVLALSYFVYLGIRSQSGAAKGLVDGRLAPCPGTPNCICTEYPDDSAHYTEPVSLDSIDGNTIMQTVQQAIQSTGGNIVKTTDSTVTAIYTSTIFRYVDDFEVRIDKATGQLHIRSASRVGKSDFGANLKRIKAFKLALKNPSQLQQ